MRIIKTLLFVFLCFSLAYAAEWTNSGATWSHAGGMSLTTPAGLTGAVDKDGVFAVKDETGAMYVSFIPAADAKEATDVINAMIGQIKKDIPDAKLSAPRSAEAAGTTVTIQDGPGTINGAVFDVTVGTLVNGNKHVCMFSLMSKADMAKWDPLMSKLMDSVTFK